MYGTAIYIAVGVAIVAGTKKLKSLLRVISHSHEIQKLTEKLMPNIHSFLEDQEVYANTKAEKKFMKYIMKIKYCLEDSNDCYNLLKQQRDRLKLEAARSNILMRIILCLQLLVLYVKQLKPLYDTGSSVMKIRRKYEEAIWPCPDSPKQHLTDPRVWFNYEDDYCHVGLDDPMKEVIKKLDLEMQKHKSRHLVAVAGQAGVGKTTLVRKVYNRVKDQFQLCAWVTVSQSYQPAHILEDILQQFGHVEQIRKDDSIAVAKLDLELIAEKFRHYMQHQYGKRYLIVLDDVWDNHLQMVLKNTLTFDQEGSRILITTRYKFHIANYWSQMEGGDVFVHQPLSEEDAIILLNRKLSLSDQCNKKEDKLLFGKILGQCPRLPLIILVIAGLLSTMSKSRWIRLLNDLGPEFRAGKSYENIKTILLSSYYALPYELRSCFLYFGMFPRDHEIEVGELIRIWVADGLIKSQRGYTLEEVAQKHVDKLMETGLVTINSVNKTTSAPSILELSKRYAKVDAIFYEIIRDKIEEQDFGVFREDSSSSSIDGSFWRLSLNNVSDYFTFEPASKILGNYRSIRSIILNSCKTFPHNLLSLFPNFIICARVIHLEDTELADEISDKMGKLQNLRLLRLTIRKSGSDLKFIGQFLNLETLHIDTAAERELETELPREIRRLSKLRHLIISLKVRIPAGVLISLTNLQTLKSVDVSQSDLVQELRKLYHLRTLHVSKLKVDDIPTFCEALQNMMELQSLQVWVENLNEHHTPIDLEMNGLLENHPKKLEELVLSANLGKTLPWWIGELKGLVCFKFDYQSDMKGDTLQVLQDLPCLEILEMNISDSVMKLNFGTKNHFKSLRVLIIRGVHVPFSLKGTLPSLETLHLDIEDKDSVDMPLQIRAKIASNNKD